MNSCLIFFYRKATWSSVATWPQRHWREPITHLQTANSSRSNITLTLKDYLSSCSDKCVWDGQWNHHSFVVVSVHFQVSISDHFLYHPSTSKVWRTLWNENNSFIRMGSFLYDPNLNACIFIHNSNRTNLNYFLTTYLYNLDLKSFVIEIFNHQVQHIGLLSHTTSYLFIICQYRSERLYSITNIVDVICGTIIVACLLPSLLQAWLDPT